MEHNEKTTRAKSDIGKVYLELEERIDRARLVDYSLLLEWIQSGRVPDDEIRSINRAIGALNNSFYRASCYYDGINPDTQKDEKAQYRAQAAALLAEYRSCKTVAARFEKAGLSARAAAKESEANATLYELFELCADNGIRPTDGKTGANSDADALIIAQFKAWSANR